MYQADHDLDGLSGEPEVETFVSETGSCPQSPPLTLLCLLLILKNISFSWSKKLYE